MRRRRIIADRPGWACCLSHWRSPVLVRCRERPGVLLLQLQGCLRQLLQDEPGPRRSARPSCSAASRAASAASAELRQRPTAPGSRTAAAARARPSPAGRRCRPCATGPETKLTVRGMAPLAEARADLLPRALVAADQVLVLDHDDVRLGQESQASPDCRRRTPAPAFPSPRRPPPRGSRPTSSLAAAGPFWRSSAGSRSQASASR